MNICSYLSFAAVSKIMSLSFKVVAAYLVIGGVGSTGIYAVVSGGVNEGGKETKEPVVEPEITVNEKVVKSEEQEVTSSPKEEVAEEKRTPKVQENLTLEIKESSKPEKTNVAVQPETKNIQPQGFKFPKTVDEFHELTSQGQEKIDQLVDFIRRKIYGY